MGEKSSFCRKIETDTHCPYKGSIMASSPTPNEFLSPLFWVKLLTMRQCSPKGRGWELEDSVAGLATLVTWREYSGKKLFPPLSISSSAEKTIANVSACNTTLLTIRKESCSSMCLEKAWMLMAPFLKLSQYLKRFHYYYQRTIVHFCKESAKCGFKKWQRNVYFHRLCVSHQPQNFSWQL